MPIKGLIETSFIDWPGQVCSVIFLGNCNFRCPFCHNSDLVLKPDSMTGQNIGYVINRLTPFKDWIDGVVITGGEPTLEPKLTAIIRELRKAGFLCKLDTNGTRPQRLADMLAEDLLESVAMDLKAPLADPLLHRRLTGVKADLAAIRRSMDILLEWTGETLFRTTAVPDIHTPEVLTRMALEVPNAKRWVLNRFQPKNCLDPTYNEITPLSEDQHAELQAVVDELIGRKG